MWRHFTDTFDVYLRLLRAVEQHLNEVLGRADPDWRVKHSCPCCHYKVCY